MDVTLSSRSDRSILEPKVDWEPLDSHLKPVQVWKQSPSETMAGEVGSTEHYEQYKADYEIRSKTQQMQEDIKEVTPGRPLIGVLFSR